MSVLRETTTYTPEVFRGISVAYGEVLHDADSPNPLSGNTSHSPSLSKVYEWLQTTPDLSLDDWVAAERLAANTRLEQLARSLAGRAEFAIALTMPEHGLTLVDTDHDPAAFDYHLPPALRVKADASLTAETYKGLVFNPADCPIVNLAYYRSGEVEAIAQIHAGAKGLTQNIIGKTVAALSARGLSPEAALAYVSPHSHQYTLHGLPLEQALDAGLGSYFSETPTPGPVRKFHFDMTRLGKDQLVDAGVAADMIETSDTDTMSDPRYFSQRAQSTQATSSQHENPSVVPFARNGFMFMKTS